MVSGIVGVVTSSRYFLQWWYPNGSISAGPQDAAPETCAIQQQREFVAERIHSFLVGCCHCFPRFPHNPDQTSTFRTATLSTIPSDERGQTCRSAQRDRHVKGGRGGLGGGGRPLFVCESVVLLFHPSARGWGGGLFKIPHECTRAAHMCTPVYTRVHARKHIPRAFTRNKRACTHILSRNYETALRLRDSHPSPPHSIIFQPSQGLAPLGASHSPPPPQPTSPHPPTPHRKRTSSRSATRNSPRRTAASTSRSTP